MRIEGANGKYLLNLRKSAEGFPSFPHSKKLEKTKINYTFYETQAFF